MREIDIEIRHTSKPGAELFAELGFTQNEAERYQAESYKLINNDIQTLKKMPNTSQAGNATARQYKKAARKP